ncbi:very short patch repair endonuclease [Actinomadura sp. 9N407]|uniref:very short patch repair endonuclease n=1 Tax=Actinomadura sp. 9N407 TaxID=3375154 RepID=UPI0037A8DBC4
MTDPARATKAGLWKDKPPPDKAWKCRPGQNRTASTAEQDRAAGGRERRLVDLGDGLTACASVELKLFDKRRRIRSYLRWSDRGKTKNKYLGEVDKDTRAENLAEGWRLAAAKGLVREAPETKSWASSPAVRSVMKANRGRDTKPELALRSAVHALGLRYRVDQRPIPRLRRRADLVFATAKVAVFSDGCYWHGCPDHYRPSKNNSEFWSDKIQTNHARDRETDRILVDEGWIAIRVWEHEAPGPAAERIAEVVRSRSG